MSTNPIPEGFHTVTPYLMVNDAAKVIRFLRDAFDAREMHSTKTPNGKIMHAQLKVGNSMVMLSDAMPDHPAMPSMLYLYVQDADAAFKKAVQAGATSMHEPKDQFYGDRAGAVKDSSGVIWWIATHKEDVAPAELEKRAEKAMKDCK